MFLWAKTCNTTIYIHIMSPHKVLGSKTLEEAFTRKKLEIGHIRISRCLTYSHVPLDKRTKLEPTVEKGIFVGYSEDFKGLSDLYSRTEENNCEAGCEVRGG